MKKTMVGFFLLAQVHAQVFIWLSPEIPSLSMEALQDACSDAPALLYFPMKYGIPLVCTTTFSVRDFLYLYSVFSSSGTVLIAYEGADMFGRGLLNNITLVNKTFLAETANVWTGCDAYGVTSLNCFDFSSNTSISTCGKTGTTSAPGWVSSTTMPCNTPNNRVYCYAKATMLPTTTSPTASPSTANPSSAPSSAPSTMAPSSAPSTSAPSTAAASVSGATSHGWDVPAVAASIGFACLAFSFPVFFLE